MSETERSLGLRKTVLLVEDESSIRSVTAEYLRGDGWVVVEASNADEAMSALNTRSLIDVAFVDFKLPGGPTGSMLAQWMETRAPRLPVLLTSGLTATHSGFGRGNLRRFVPKPYELSVVCELLNKMVDT